MLGQSFPANARIKKRKDFLHVQERGKKVFSRHFVITLKETETNTTRIGITVSKRVDKRAIARNSVKRKIREIFRTHREQLQDGYDIVVIARQGTPLLSFQDTKKELLKNLRKAGVMQ